MKPKKQPQPGAGQDLTLAQRAKDMLSGTAAGTATTADPSSPAGLPNVDDPNVQEEVRAEERRARKQRGRKQTLATGEPLYKEDKTIAEGFM